MKMTKIITMASCSVSLIASANAYDGYGIIPVYNPDADMESKRWEMYQKGYAETLRKVEEAKIQIKKEEAKRKAEERTRKRVEGEVWMIMGSCVLVRIDTDKVEIGDELDIFGSASDGRWSYSIKVGSVIVDELKEARDKEGHTMKYVSCKPKDIDAKFAKGQLARRKEKEE